MKKLLFLFVFAFCVVQIAFCADPPNSPPSPAPESGADSISPPPFASAPSSSSPSPSFGSPPAPPPSDLAPGSPPSSPPAPAPTSSSPDEIPSPSPTPLSDISHANAVNADEDSPKSSSGGMKSAQKAGVAVGVISAACIAGVGVIVYKKRQQNIRRSQYGYAARREIL